MSYLSIYNYVRDIAIQLPGMDSNRYFHGRKPLLTHTDVGDDIFVWCLPFTSSGSFTEIGQQFNEDVSINIIFYKKDALDSGLDQNDQETISPEIQVLADTRELAQEFIRRFNFNQELDTGEFSEEIQINSISFNNVIKDNAHFLTGTTLELSVLVPDKFDYCKII